MKIHVTSVGLINLNVKKNSELRKGRKREKARCGNIG